MGIDACLKHDMGAAKAKEPMGFRDLDVYEAISTKSIAHFQNNFRKKKEKLREKNQYLLIEMVSYLLHPIRCFIYPLDMKKKKILTLF